MCVVCEQIVIQSLNPNWTSFYLFVPHFHFGVLQPQWDVPMFAIQSSFIDRSEMKMQNFESPSSKPNSCLAK